MNFGHFNISSRLHAVKAGREAKSTDPALNIWLKSSHEMVTQILLPKKPISQYTPLCTFNFVNSHMDYQTFFYFSQVKFLHKLNQCMVDRTILDLSVSLY